MSSNPPNRHTPSIRALLLFGSKGGDNAQIRMLAARLQLPADSVQLSFNGLHVLPNFLRPSSLFSITRSARDHLAKAERPDVVISSGKRSYRAARWVKERFGARTTWIHLGRPWGPSRAIDLVLTVPQYGLPQGENVCVLPYPIRTLEFDDGRLAERRRPRLAVLVGGHSSTHKLDQATVAALVVEVRRLSTALGAQVTYLTSPRTPPSVCATLRTQQAPGTEVRLWRRPPPGRTTHEYRDLLHEATAFMVTSDSASMVADAFDTGKPVFVFRARKRLAARVASSVESTLRGLFAAPTRRGAGRWPQRLAASVITSGLLTPPRDMERLVDALSIHGNSSPPPFPAAGLRSVHLERGGAATSLELAADAVSRLLARSQRPEEVPAATKIKAARQRRPVLPAGGTRTLAR
ncbi:MAG: hypothetical protein Kow0092_27560 [Deferrisomatales bacterium]